MQEVALIICEKSDEELEKLNEYFNFWAARTIMNMASKTGKLGRVRLRNSRLDHKEMVDFDYEPEIDEKYCKVIEILDELYWYKRDLFMTYVEEGSLSKVTEKTKINRYSVWNNLKEVRDTVKDRMK